MPRSSGPERQGAPPSGAEKGAARGPLLPSTPASPSPDEASAAEGAPEDFLFHLYRGSELLQENRALEAQAELEFALALRPLDAKGQDLLAAACFRVGSFARAAALYDALATRFPHDVSVKINLALCHFKAGEVDLARRALQDAVRVDPEHKRAWAYLGLALQKLGDFDGARDAFERGGHATMAKRVLERRRSLPPDAALELPGADVGVREVAETAFQELDGGELRFSLAEPEPARADEGRWHAVELGEPSRAPMPRAVTSPPVAVRERAAHHDVVTMPPPSVPLAAPGLPDRVEPRTAASTRLVPPPLSAAAPGAQAAQAAVDVPSLLDVPTDRPVALRTPGVLVVQVSDEPPRHFAARLEALRVVAGTVSTRVLHRRTRDADTAEVLGGIGSPLVRVAGSAQLVLGARPRHELSVLALGEDLAFVREDLLLGFELSLAYENGRVAVEAPAADGPRSGDGIPFIQLRGTGAAVLELAGTLARLPSTPGRPLIVRRDWVAGWLGRLVTHALPPEESPGGQRALIGFAGGGTVLVCAA